MLVNSSIYNIENVQERFKCVQCSVKLKDVKLLKNHFWKVHISENEIFNDIKATEKVIVKPSVLSEKKENQSSLSKKRKLNNSDVNCRKKRYDDQNSLNESSFVNSLSDTLNDIDSSIDTNNIDAVEKIKSLTPSEIETFNLSSIDERKFIEKFKPFDNLADFNKSSELKPGKIVWAKWRIKGQDLMWPSKVVKLVTRKNVIKKVCIRYYEMNRLFSHVFKLDLSKIQLFFRSVENHLKNKEAALKDINRRYEFFRTYSDALEDFQSQQLNQGETDTSKKLFNSENFLVINKMMKKDEIVTLAHAQLSEEQLKTNQDREIYSKDLLDILKSNECEDYIVSVITEKVECNRQKAYFTGDVKNRKAMKFSSPGPLIISHQSQLADMLESLQKIHFPNKPSHLKNYEYDVLYPEAVIWAIQRLDDVNYKKAELKYKKGFQQTKEELTKQKCNEILHKINEKSNKQKIVDNLAPVDEDFQSDSSLGTINYSVQAVQPVNLDSSTTILSETIESILDIIENNEISNEILNNNPVIKDISVAMELEKSMSNDDSITL